MSGKTIWLYFAWAQLVQMAAAALGWVVLLPFCAAHAWTECPSAFDEGRSIDCWKWHPLNAWYSNPEDGVSGKYALVWDSAGHRVPYMPNAPAWWRAYCWSAWRNSADMLKYRFPVADGPLVQFTAFGMRFRAGWQTENGIKVPVLEKL